MAVNGPDQDSVESPPGGWPDPRSAYIHVPFCRHRCGYCNFSVVADRDDLIERFLRAVDTELSWLNRPTVQTVFIGGGTPTHLSIEQLGRLLEMVRQRLDFETDVEWSIEANPEDITDEKLDVLVGHGVNRVSLGVQSFDDAKLQTLERGHRGISARQTIERVADRIANVSIDLIFAAPSETAAVWQRDLEIALDLPICHLSTYALTFEKGTRFWSQRRRGELQPAGESLEVELYQRARESAAANGFEHYEVSSFARPDFRCRHNQAYWRGEGWFGVGPGAARFVAGSRDLNHRSTTTYLRRIETSQDPVAEREPIPVEEHARERAGFGVRMIEGVDLKTIHNDTGIDLECLCADAIEQLVKDGWLIKEGTHLRLTDEGVLFADAVASRLLG